jgi:hypothetical protein
MHDTPRSPRRRAKAAIGLAASALVLGGIGVAGAVTSDPVDDTGTSDSTSTTTTEATDPTTPETSVEPTTTATSIAPVDDVVAQVEDAPEPDDADGLPGPDDNFGQWVSTQAREGGVDGQEISAAAHARNEARKAAREADGEDEADEDGESVPPAHAGPPASHPGKGKGGPHS